MQLNEHHINHVILVGLLANTCTETTARYALELGYHVTLMRDATAAFSKEMMRAAHEVNGPTAHAIFTTSELIAALPRRKGSMLEVAHVWRFADGTASDASHCDEAMRSLKWLAIVQCSSRAAEAIAYFGNRPTDTM